MNNHSFESYSEKHLHFYDLTIPKLLCQMLSERQNDEKFDLVDLGCGDGNLLYNLKRKGFLDKANTVVGVDVSPRRIEVLRKNIDTIQGIVSDASNVKQLNDCSFDMVIASQIIEHVPDDNKFAQEISRLLKTTGTAFVSTVIKKPYAFYIYMRNGQFRIDPTHIREYKSEKQIIELLESNSLVVKNHTISRIKYPITDLILRFLVNRNLLDQENVRSLYISNNLVRKTKIFSVPIIGYYTIETLCKKK